MAERICVTCGLAFTPAVWNQTACSKPCIYKRDRQTGDQEKKKLRKAEYNRRWLADNPHKRAEYRERYAETTARYERTVERRNSRRRAGHRRSARRRSVSAARGSRGRYVWSSGVCAVCSETFVHWGPTRTCSSECSRQLKRQRKNERGRARYAQLRLEVFERDAWLCGICGDPTNRDAIVPDLDAPVVDHILPRNRGGSDELVNLQCAHFYCNSVKRDQIGFSAVA